MESTDFLNILKEHGQLPDAPAPEAANGSTVHTEGTTILALRYRDGVLVAGDRRATAGNTVVYDRAAKVLSVGTDSFGIPHVKSRFSGRSS